MQNKLSELQKITEKSFIAYCHHFDQCEIAYRNGVMKTGDRDLWFTEYAFLRNANQMDENLKLFKELLFKVWDDA